MSKDLFNGLVEEFEKRGVRRFKIVVGDELLGAKRFYEKMGCVAREEPIEVHKGETSRVYTYEC